MRDKMTAINKYNGHERDSYIQFHRIIEGKEKATTIYEYKKVIKHCYKKYSKRQLKNLLSYIHSKIIYVEEKQEGLVLYFEFVEKLIKGVPIVFAIMLPIGALIEGVQSDYTELLKEISDKLVSKQQSMDTLKSALSSIEDRIVANSGILKIALWSIIFYIVIIFVSYVVMIIKKKSYRNNILFYSEFETIIKDLIDHK